MNNNVLKEALIVLCTATTITFGAISAIADDFFGDDDMKNADYIIESIKTSKTTLAGLVVKAEAETKGIALEIEIEDEDGVQYVEIDILRGKEIVQVKASLKTGEILNISQPKFMPTLIENICSNYDSIKQNTLGMENAIKQAELKTCSTAYKAELENIDGLLCYQVHLFTPQRTITVMLDPKSGRLLSQRHMKHTDNDDR